MRAELYTVELLPNGCLSLMAHPRGGDWLDDEITALWADGVDVLASLLTADEIRELNLGKEAELCQAHNILYLTLPISDLGVPPFDPATLAFLERLNGLLLEGKHVAIHCRMGVGRSGLIASSLLVLNGYAPQQAFVLLSSTRGYKVPETEGQGAWVVALHQQIQAQNNFVPE